MKAALVVTDITLDVAQNKRRILRGISAALDHDPDIVVLPETATTGYQDIGDPAHDRTLCEEIGGDFLEKLRQLAIEGKAMISIGFFEKEQQSIYDSSLILSARGEVVQHYRRVDKHWRNKGVDPEIYRCGDRVMRSMTPHGSMSTLICGDLFNDEVLRQVRILAPDVLLYPLAATPEGGLSWMEAVRGDYAERLRLVGSYTLMVNLLECGEGWSTRSGSRIGGACVLDPHGDVVAFLSPGSPGTLIHDLDINVARGPAT